MRHSRRRTLTLTISFIAGAAAIGTALLVHGKRTALSRRLPVRPPVDRIAWVERTSSPYGAIIRSDSRSVPAASPIQLPTHQSTLSGNGSLIVPVSRGAEGDKGPRNDFRDDVDEDDDEDEDEDADACSGDEQAAGRASDEDRSPDEPTSAKGAAPLDDSILLAVDPAALFQHLEPLAEEKSLADWADVVRLQVDRLFSVGGSSAATKTEVVRRLRQLVDAGQSLSHGQRRYELRASLDRAIHALQRRVDLWRQYADWSDEAEESQAAASPIGREVVEHILRAAQIELTGDGELTDWRAYLLVDSMSDALRSGDEPRSRTVGRKILKRMAAPSLTSRQHVFLMRPAIAQLRSALEWYTADQPRYLELISVLEEFEQVPSVSNQARFAAALKVLQGSPRPDLSDLGRNLEIHYRNANLRVVVDNQLLNRLLPDVAPREDPVSERLLGADVSGRSATSTQLSVRLMPDPDHVRVRLEAQGMVASDTAARKGPVTIYSEGAASYVASKLFLLGGSGLISDRAWARADSRSWTKQIRSNYDGVPLIGAIVRGIARDRQAEQMPLARRHMNYRVSSTASRRLDEEVDARMNEIVERLDAKFVKPFEKLGLEPRAVALGTTEDRITMRFRLAGQHQLASHTPRPMALTDSLASLQIHQSAVNNIIQQLGLGMTPSDLRGLYDEAFRKLNLEENHVPDDVPRGVTVELNHDRPIRVSCGAGRITLEINVDKLSHRRRTWRNFVVRVHYEPRVTGLRVVLERSGYLELIGRLRTRDQFSLRGIFTKALGRNRTISIVPRRFVEDPRLAGLEIGQCMITDGWIGLAWVPSRPSALASQPDVSFH